MLTPQDVIVTHDLQLGYKNSPLVSQVTLNIGQGEFIGIFGPNGSGKSTFLKSILGLIKPLKGTLSVFGTKPQHGNTNLGYMPQLRTQHLGLHLTGRSVLEASIRGTRLGLPFLSKQEKLAVQAVIDLVKANGFADRSFHYLSGGERQRIFLAQALLGNPRILLLDEPLSGLDPRFQETFIELLHFIQQKLKSTILFTAHDPNPLLKVMNRVLYFAKGKVLNGTVEEVMTSEKLSALYETTIEVIRYKNRIIVLGDERNLYGQEEQHHD